MKDIQINLYNCRVAFNNNIISFYFSINTHNIWERDEVEFVQKFGVLFLRKLRLSLSKDINVQLIKRDMTELYNVTEEFK